MQSLFLSELNSQCIGQGRPLTSPPGLCCPLCSPGIVLCITYACVIPGGCNPGMSVMFSSLIEGYVLGKVRRARGLGEARQWKLYDTASADVCNKVNGEMTRLRRASGGIWPGCLSQSWRVEGVWIPKPVARLWHLSASCHPCCPRNTRTGISFW